MQTSGANKGKDGEQKGRKKCVWWRGMEEYSKTVSKASLLKGTVIQILTLYISGWRCGDVL